MKKFASFLLVFALLSSCIPAFAVRDCSAIYADGVLTYACTGNTMIEVYLDGAPLDSASGNSVAGAKTLVLEPGAHTVTFEDMDSSQSVTVQVPDNSSSDITDDPSDDVLADSIDDSTGDIPADSTDDSTGDAAANPADAVCTHAYSSTPVDVSIASGYEYDAAAPNIHTLVTRQTDTYACTLCGETRTSVATVSSLTESHKLSGAANACCSLCNAEISYATTAKITKVALSKSGTVSLAIGDTLQLGVTLTPSNGATSLKWTSSRSKYASVDSNGLVTAKKAGTATITVKTANGKKDTVKIKVYDPTIATSVKLLSGGETVASRIKLALGSSLTLDAAVAPTTAVTTCKWTTSAPKSVTLSNKTGSAATITAQKVGSSTITVKTANGKRDKVRVTVFDPTIATKIALDLSGTYLLGVGDTIQLGYAMSPSTATNSVRFSSSRRKYAAVSADGTVTGVAKGTATITVKTSNGKKDTVKIRVVNPDVVAAVKLNKTGTVSLKVGQTLQLTPSYAPTSAAAPTYAWKSSNAKYATVDQDGLITAVKPGRTVKITCTTNNGKKATVKIKTVK